MHTGEESIAIAGCKRVEMNEVAFSQPTDVRCAAAIDRDDSHDRGVRSPVDLEAEC